LVGLLTFFISPLADNLTTALLMATVVVAVGGSNEKFVVACCINVVVAANAGGVFSPFGDITTLMAWQQGAVPFQDFLTLFVPALVNWLVPAVILSFLVPEGKPQADEAALGLGYGAYVIIGLFIVSIAFAISVEHFLNLPAVIGMMTGLGVLKLYGYFLKRRGISHTSATTSPGKQTSFDIFRSLERAEWDTLMFMYGILMSVSGLSAMGYLILGSELTYEYFGPTVANIGVGLLSAVIENVPVMFTVLTMQPDMDSGQWLLVTLTAGVGGSLLSIGSAAGIAVMGQSGGAYTFFTHLRWSWAIALGYGLSIWIHMSLNAAKFGGT
jgi:Na+/H+ antiporter NhaD/arsenite permease-like protein